MLQVENFQFKYVEFTYDLSNVYDVIKCAYV